MKNLVILTIARSGSSMVASIFAAHGFDCPPGLRQRKMSDGSEYWTYERPAFKQFYRQNRINEHGEIGEFFEYKDTHLFHEMVDRLPEPWVIKVGVNMWPLFKKMDVVVVKVRRDQKSHARSMSKKKHQPYGQTLSDIKDKSSLFGKVPGFYVYSDEIVNGDFSSLEPVFKACGVEFDKEIAESCIDTSKWHYTNDKTNA